MTRFRKTLTAGLAALTLGASLAATATPADAFGRHGWRGGGIVGGGWCGRFRRSGRQTRNVVYAHIRQQPHPLRGNPANRRHRD